MLNLGIDGKEAVKIEKRCATNAWHTLYGMLGMSLF